MRRTQRSSRVRLNANRVWEMMNQLHMAQNELARQSGISSGYLSQLITGTRCPSPELRRRLVEALHVTQFEELFILEEVS